jgi:hypothetical protein
MAAARLCVTCSSPLEEVTPPVGRTQPVMRCPRCGPTTRWLVVLDGEAIALGREKKASVLTARFKDRLAAAASPGHEVPLPPLSRRLRRAA